MKLKLAIIAGFILAGSLFGLTQNAEAALPGQVGNAPRCTVDTGKARDNSFVVNGSTASVTFIAEGGANCRVQVSNNSFYAPSMNGQPWSAQILYDRNTKTVGPGKHTLAIKVPTKSTKEKGCFYQLDLTYGQRNVLPVLAYEHGAIKDCGQVTPPKPEAACVSLTAKKLTRTSFQLNAKSSVKNGATIKGYVFTITGNGTTVTRTVNASSLTAAHVYTQTKPGTYTAKVTVKTSVGDKTAAACTTKVTVTPEVPGKIDVCEIATKKIVTINKDQMSNKYTTDPTKCAETPETPATPVATTPEALPVTGAGAVFAIFTGVTSLSSAAYYLFSRRLL